MQNNPDYFIVENNSRSFSSPDALREHTSAVSSLLDALGHGAHRCLHGSHLNTVLCQCFHFPTLPSALRNLMRMPFLVPAAPGRSHTGDTGGACCPIGSSSISDFLQVPLDQRRVAGPGFQGTPREPRCRLLLDQEEAPPYTSVFGCLFSYGHWESIHSRDDTVRYQRLYFSPLLFTDCSFS